MSGVDLPFWTVLLPVFGYVTAVAVAIGLASTNRRNAVVPSTLIAFSAALGVGISINALLNGDTHTSSGWTLIDGIRINFRCDPVAAFFLLVISLPAIAAAIYGIGYLDAPHDLGHGHTALAPRAGSDGALAAFLAAMSVLVLADSVLGFLIAWELMSLISFFLVIGDGHNIDRRTAAYTYVVMTHVATAFIIFAFLGLGQHAHGLDFVALRDSAGTLGAWQRNAIFLSALVGFGTKAGLIPVHIWLPKAHPAAPSHVSALMSGVMVKTAIYGLVRVIFELAGPGPRWWGYVLIAAGATSALLGIMYALMERDLKRVLAFSTVEHLGILTLGLGVATVAYNQGNQAVASFALFAVFVHLLNHTVFKSLLFLGAGAIQTATGTRDLERLGGLIKRMPRTAALFLIGAGAISALPPLNGFAGEWLLFQSLLKMGDLDGSARIATLAGIGAGALALTGALAVVCFVRAFGIGFLAQPRTDAAGDAIEVSPTMQVGMGILAVCCLLFGIGATYLIRLIAPAVSALSDVEDRPPLLFARGISASTSEARYAPLVIVLVLGAIGIVPWAVARLANGPARERIAPPWVCGNDIEPGMQYTATAFAKPLRLIFQFVIRPERKITIERPTSPFVVKGVRYEETLHPVYERFLYNKVTQGLFAVSRRIRPLQSGSIRAYLGYVLVTLVVVILLAR